MDIDLYVYMFILGIMFGILFDIILNYTFKREEYFNRCKSKKEYKMFKKWLKDNKDKLS